MAKDPYREIAEQHKQPLKKVKVKEIEAEAVAEGLQRPVKQKQEKNSRYPLLTVLLVFFIASPFIAVYAFKDDTPERHEKVTQKAEPVSESPVKDGNAE